MQSSRVESNSIQKDESLPQPLSHFMDLAKAQESESNGEVDANRMYINPSKSESLLETSDHMNRNGVQMQDSNLNNLQSLTSIIRAPSFSAPNDFQATVDYPDLARQGTGMTSSKPLNPLGSNYLGNSNAEYQYAKDYSELNRQGTGMSTSKPMNSSGNVFMSSSNPDYVAEDPMGLYYENQVNVSSQESSAKNSTVLKGGQHLAPTVFIRAPSKIEVKSDPSLNDSYSKLANGITPSPLGIKSPYTFDSEHPSPFPNLNQSMKPMLAANSNTKLNVGKFFDSTSPISQSKTPNTIPPNQVELRARGGIYNLQPKFETLQESQSVVEIYGLSKEFDLLGRTEKVRALSDVNLNDDSDFYPIKRGEFVMIRGPSGGGKTTFLNLIGTADSASSGRLVIMGSEINEKSNDEYLSRLRLEKIGFVFQTFNLLATMSAYENVELPMKLLGKLSTKNIKQRTIELLTKVGLQDRMDHLPSELSGGEQQRVAIARALANTPEILLLDEPTGDLDTRSTVEVMNLLLSINNFGYTSDQRKCTMIMVTHNPDIECYADRIIYFRDGKIVKQVINEVQTPLELEPYLKFLNAHNNE